MSLQLVTIKILHCIIEIYRGKDCCYTLDWIIRVYLDNVPMYNDHRAKKLL